MLKTAIAGIVLAACGFAGTSAAAAPFSPSSDIFVAPAAENVRVVCRERTVWRRNKWGEPRRVTIRDCDRYGGGPGYYGYGRPHYAEPGRGRYYHEGHYYSDPGFTVRIR